MRIFSMESVEIRSSYRLAGEILTAKNAEPLNMELSAQFPARYEISVCLFNSTILEIQNCHKFYSS